jgi:hypothetical protein
MALQAPPLPRLVPVPTGPTWAAFEEAEMEARVWRQEGAKVVAVLRPAILRLHFLAVVGGDLQAEQLAAATIAQLDRFARRFTPDAA